MLIRDNLETRLIAFYLPQYHPIPENDAWWGKGFTEWTNVTRAKPRFPGHYQPHLPADLGFYDLRLAEAREAQANLAREYGIHGFCYYHYWFKGRRLLERPFQEVLASGKPDFPFCLCWANENWTRRWDGRDREILLGQSYTQEDYLDHIRSLITTFRDPRYIRIDGRPLFLIYRAGFLPDPLEFTNLWREESRKLGVGDLFLCRVESWREKTDPRHLGFDAAVEFQPQADKLMSLKQTTLNGVWRHKLFKGSRQERLIDYQSYVQAVLSDVPVSYPRISCVCPSWDNSARVANSVILLNSTPEVYGRWLRSTLESLEPMADGGRYIFINAWNEWAEGNHLEPCQRWGRAYLEATKEQLIASRMALQD